MFDLREGYRHAQLDAGGLRVPYKDLAQHRDYLLSHADATFTQFHHVRRCFWKHGMAGKDRRLGELARKNEGYFHNLTIASLHTTAFSERLAGKP